MRAFLPYDPAIPLLGIYPEKSMVQKDTCTPMFIAALFTIAKIWKQPKCPSADEWIKKMWHIDHIHRKTDKMKRQRTMCQMKEQDKIPEKQLNEVEIGNLPRKNSE